MQSQQWIKSVNLSRNQTQLTYFASLSLKAGELKTFLRKDEILELPRWQNTSKMFSVVSTTRNSSTTHSLSSTPSKTVTKTISISVHQISEQQFSRLLIGSLSSEYPWIFTVLGRDSKWLLVSRQFQKITFQRLIKQLHQQIPRKRQNLACRCLQVDRKKISC